MKNYVYVVVKTILDNERFYLEAGKTRGGSFDLRSKSVREVFFTLEDAQAYINEKVNMFRDYGRSIYEWENGKVVECSKIVRDSWVRIDKYEIVVKEVR